MKFLMFSHHFNWTCGRSVAGLRGKRLHSLIRTERFRLNGSFEGWRTLQISVTLHGRALQHRAADFLDESARLDEFINTKKYLQGATKQATFIIV